MPTFEDPAADADEVQTALRARPRDPLHRRPARDPFGARLADSGDLPNRLGSIRGG